MRRPKYAPLFRRLRPALGTGVALLFLAQIVLSGLTVLAAPANESPDRRYLFREDLTNKKAATQKKAQLSAKQRQIAKANAAKGFPFDINATSIRYDTGQKMIFGEGGVIISYGASTIESEEGRVDVEHKVAELSGDVRVTDLSGAISASSASLNLSEGTGELNFADMYFTDGDYRLYADKLNKVGPDNYTFRNGFLSTCSCPEPGCRAPWELEAEEGKITRDGYGQVWNAIFRAYDVPVMYFPYLIFPAKTKRQTGLLAPQMGLSGRYGFEFHQPFYMVFDDSSDATISPFIQTNARVGTDFEMRKIFSRDDNLELGGMALNESMRGDKDLGTNTDGLYQPEHKIDRLGAYLNAYTTSDAIGQQLQFIANGKYVSDNLLLREYESPNIDPYNTRFVTSDATMRVSFLDEFTFETTAEYNQSLVSDPNYVFQKLPSLSLDGLHTFRPFGQNPFGLKLVLIDSVTYDNFIRTQDYDGSRSEVFEKMKVPFFLGNYLDGSITPEIRASYYSLNDTTYSTVDGSGNPIESDLQRTSSRLVPGMSAQIGTVMEKVFDVDEDNPIKMISELGEQGRQGNLVRVKHTLEPTIKYRYVPYVDQTENPQFDSNDNLARRNVVTYSLMQRLYGRFTPRSEYMYGIEEATPEINDLPMLSTKSPIDESYNLGLPTGAEDEFRAARSGSRDELANFEIGQSFDFFQYQNPNLDPTLTPAQNNAFSDVGMALTLYPNEYFHVYAGTTVSPQTTDFTSYTLSGQLLDKRGDQVRARFSYIAGTSPVRELEMNSELRVTNRMRFGWYTRYDDEAGQFLENRFGVRFKSDCNCWIFDLYGAEKLNPSETRFMFNITFVGLGEFGNSLYRKSGSGS